MTAHSLNRCLENGDHYRVSRFKCSVNPMNKKMMCVGNITATVKRSDFGMVRYIPAISDEIKITVPVEAYKD